jgi:hypothetical protein
MVPAVPSIEQPKGRPNLAYGEAMVPARYYLRDPRFESA